LKNLKNFLLYLTLALNVNPDATSIPCELPFLII